MSNDHKSLVDRLKELANEPIEEWQQRINLAYGSALLWKNHPVKQEVENNIIKPTDEQIHKLAEEIYNADRNERMPPWDECPYSYSRGYINDAAVRLGWKPESHLKLVKSEGGSNV